MLVDTSAETRLVLQRDYWRTEARRLKALVRGDISSHAKAQRRLKKLRAEMRATGVRP